MEDMIWVLSNYKQMGNPAINTSLTAGFDVTKKRMNRHEQTVDISFVQGLIS